MTEKQPIQSGQGTGLKESHIKILFFASLVLLFGAIHFMLPDFYRTIWELSVSGNMEGTIEYLRSFGVWAMLVSLIIDVVINIVGFLPSIFISTANGVLFGIYVGTFVSWMGETIGVIISFFFMRSLFRHSAEQIIRKSRMLSKLDEYSTVKAMIIARAVPYAPNGLVTALGALSHISYRDYALGCLIGKLPSVAVEVVVGHDVINYEENMIRLTVVTLLVVVVYGGLWYWNRRRKKKENKTK
jgi:uncharacterized membrane protein YdjX (TVP38/TMEM64 family)